MATMSIDTPPGAGKGVEWLARMGYTAKGVVYITVGVLAAMTAFGIGGGATTGTEGAVNRIEQQPFGHLLIGLVALGLIGYVLWRFTQAVRDPEHKGNDAGGLIQRAGFLISGIIYGLLAFYTVDLLLGSMGGGGGSSGSQRSLTAELMSHRGGIWATGAIGAIIVGAGIAQLVRAYREKFKERWCTWTMSPAQEAWATRASKWGLGARGVVFAIIGGFLIAAAWYTDPRKTKGLEGALDQLAAQNYGRWLLGVVALGLVCYGFYCFLNARYRWIDV